MVVVVLDVALLGFLPFAVACVLLDGLVSLLFVEWRRWGDVAALLGSRGLLVAR